jgi:hypothetical protein
MAAFALIFSATAHAGGTDLAKDQAAIEKILKKAVCVCTSTLHRVGFLEVRTGSFFTQFLDVACVVRDYDDSGNVTGQGDCTDFVIGP